METITKTIKSFSASRIGELLAGGTGKTAQNYCLDLALESIGIKDGIDTPATRHGLNNQLSAFEVLVKRKFPDAVWYDEFIPINDKCGASPDSLAGVIPNEIKCPFYIDTFLEQINTTPKKYLLQNQMQMMATGSDVGFIWFYLTKPEEWGVEEWNEYPFPLELRQHCVEVKKDDEAQYTILEKVEHFHPVKLSFIKLLEEAEVIDYEQFFYVQMSGFSYRKLKDCNNILNLDKCIRVGNDFYYEKAVKDVPVIETIKTEVPEAPKKDYSELIKKGKELKEKAKI